MTQMRNVVTMVVTGLFSVVSAEALAGNLSYQGQNAAIFAGANPAGNAALMASVPRKKDPNQNSGAGGLTPAAIVQQGVLSQVSNQIYTQLFDNSNASGSFDLGGGNTINYLRVGGNLVITFFDPINGQTVITIPDL